MEKEIMKYYCRLCAEPKHTDKMLDLLNDEAKLNEVLEKLTFLNAMYVEIASRDNSLPKTICFVCYDSLTKAYDFLFKVKKAQVDLTTIFPINDTELHESSDDDRIGGFDDFLQTKYVDSVKHEGENVEKQEPTVCSVEVKMEPKEENNILENRNPDIQDEMLDVQDIFDAAMCNSKYSGVTIYAKEVKNANKRSILTWKEYPWICVHCDMEFLDIVTLRLHSKLTHRKCNAFVCIDCDSFAPDDYDSFIRHVKQHRKRLRKRCHYCDEIVESKDELQSHVQNHFIKSETACKLCGEILKISDLQKHLESNLEKPKRKPRRKRGTPLTIEDLTCELCKKVYKNPNSLRDHMKIHTDDRKRNYTCDRCGKMFYNKGTLTSHIMAHDQVRPHKCRICSKSFLFPNMLRRHVEMHSGVKPFSCEQCGRCFRLQYQLNTHKIIHTDSMPHVCQYCNKAFRFKQILKNHERQHTGAKPYSCAYCGMEFTNWSNFNKHMKRRHDTDTSKKKITPEGVFPINPQTGQIMQFTDDATEEWKTKIMIPGKRGKKKVIKKEDNT